MLLPISRNLRGSQGTRILKDPKLVNLYSKLSSAQRRDAARLLDQALEREGISFAGKGVAREIRGAGAARAERVKGAGERATERVRRVGAGRAEDVRRRGERAKELFSRRKDVIKADVQRRSKFIRFLKIAALAAAGSTYFRVQLGLGSFE